MPNLPISGLPAATTINDADLFAISQSGTTKKFTFQDLTSDTKIIFRKGTNAERLLITPLEGEAIYVTDTKQLYLGDGSTIGGNWFAGGDTLKYISEVFTIRKTAIGTAITPVQTLENTTVATNVLAQNSPAVRLKGNAWNTDIGSNFATQLDVLLRSVSGDPPTQELVIRNADGGEVSFRITGLDSSLSVSSISAAFLTGVTSISLNDISNSSSGNSINLDSGGEILYSATAHVFTGDFKNLGKTIAPGNGAVTIDAVSGAVNFAAAATSLVVTNSLVTSNSIILISKATNDSTAVLDSVVADAGSFTIRMKTAPTGTTRVNFWIVN